LHSMGSLTSFTFPTCFTCCDETEHFPRPHILRMNNETVNQIR
jgi:hypothetical protein